jgi:hypothetical protein
MELDLSGWDQLDEDWALVVRVNLQRVEVFSPLDVVDAGAVGAIDGSQPSSSQKNRILKLRKAGWKIVLKQSIS